jgi:hypothetical protein
LALSLFLVAELLFVAFARHHFIPARRLESALSAQPVDVLIAGDSRMVAALDHDRFQSGWRACGGRLPRIADLSLGGVDVTGQAIAIRRFFEAGGMTESVLLGTVPESLVQEPANLDAWIGNEAIVLWWSHARDVGVHFWLPTSALNPKKMDDTLRFLAYRMSSLASLRSLLWARVQEGQDRLLERRVAVAHAGFGRDDDMRALARTFIENGLHQVQGDGRSWKVSPWVCEIRRQVEAHGAKLVLAELPMPAAYQQIRSSTVGRLLRQKLPTDLCGRAVVWIDVSEPRGLTEERFSDGIHLDRVGAAITSHSLGCQVSRLAAAPE